MEIMVLLSKLFFFASIMCYDLGTSSSPPKADCREIVESIEQKLKGCSNDKQKVDVLREHIINARFSNALQSAAVQGVLKALMDRVINDANEQLKGAVFNAYLTRQALTNLEWNAFPEILYDDENLTHYTKWMLALTLYRTPILNKIHAAISKDGVTFGQFAHAVNNLHSLFSAQFPHPELQYYSLPKTRENIEKFCSFVNELKLGTVVRKEQLPVKQHVTMMKSYKKATHLACRCAFTYSEPLIDPEQWDEIINGPACPFSAVIVIRNASDSDEKEAENFLNTMLEETEFKDNVEKKQVKRIPLEEQVFEDPNESDKVLDKKFDLVFHFVCDSLPTYANINKDNYGLRIRDRLSTHFNDPKKAVILLRTCPAYVLNSTKS